MRIKLAILIIAALISAQNIYALGKDSIGTSGAQFLELGTNARAVAMGEAYSAVTDGSESIYWNPAGLVNVERRSFSLLHAVYFQNISYDFASYANRIGEIGVVGAGVQYLNAGSIDRTNRSGSNIGTFNPYDLALSFGWAKTFKDLGSGEDFSLGITGKYIQSRVVETAVGGAADIGLLWEPSYVYLLKISLVAQNIGGQLKFKNESDPLPFIFKLGSAYTPLEDWILGFDLNFPNDGRFSASLGTEYKIEFSKNLSIAWRSGYNTKTSADISGLTAFALGAGFGWKNYSLDFSWQPFGVLGNSYLVGISGKF